MENTGKNLDLVKAGQKLRAIREDLGLTRHELAKLLGRSYQTVRNAEGGNQKLSRTSWEKVNELKDKSQACEKMQAPEFAVCEDADEYRVNDDTVSLADVAMVVADQDVQAAVKAMISAGISPVRAWKVIINAKLKEMEK